MELRASEGQDLAADLGAVTEVADSEVVTEVVDSEAVTEAVTEVVTEAVVTKKSMTEDMVVQRVYILTQKSYIKSKRSCCKKSH